MNLFFLDMDPVLAAQYQCDQHVVKMPTETAQMLCTAHYVLDGSNVWKPSYINHPCNVWIRESIENYEWAALHYSALYDEFRRRYKPYHRSFFEHLTHPPLNIPNRGFTQPPLCMPDEYAGYDLVESYRAYYRSKTFARWRYTDKPEWL